MPCNRGIHQYDGSLENRLIDDIQFIIKKYFIAVWRATYGENTYLFFSGQAYDLFAGTDSFPV